MLRQRIENASQGLLGDFEIPLDCVVAVHEHFRFDDRHQITFLTKCRVTRQRLRVGVDAGARGNPIADGNHGAPLRKARSELPVFGQPVP